MPWSSIVQNSNWLLNEILFWLGISSIEKEIYLLISHQRYLPSTFFILYNKNISYKNMRRKNAQNLGTCYYKKNIPEAEERRRTCSLDTAQDHGNTLLSSNVIVRQCNIAKVLCMYRFVFKVSWFVIILPSCRLWLRLHVINGRILICFRLVCANGKELLTIMFRNVLSTFEAEIIKIYFKGS